MSTKVEVQSEKVNLNVRAHKSLPPSGVKSVRTVIQKRDSIFHKRHLVVEELKTKSAYDNEVIRAYRKNSEKKNGLCSAQNRSLWKALLFLFLILSISAGLIFWLYQNKFGFYSTKNDFGQNFASNPNVKISAVNRTGKSYPGEVQSIDVKIRESIVKTIKDSDPDLYIDYDGNLHRVEDRLKNLNKIEEPVRNFQDTFVFSTSKDGGVVVVKERKKLNGSVALFGTVRNSTKSAFKNNNTGA